MLKTYCLLLSLFFLPFSIYASNDKPPIIWGKVTEAEKNMQAPEHDPDAPAIILCDYGEIEVTNRTFYKRHIRIKILKEEGLQYASIEIPYRTKNNHDDITEIKAHSLTFDNTGVVEYKIKQKDIYTIKVNEENYKKVFTFPNIIPGTIVEYKYTIASLDFAELDTWYFQHEIPIVWSEVRFKTPQFFTYLATFQKGEPLTKAEQDEYVGKLNWMGLVKYKEAKKELEIKNNILYEIDKRYRVFVVNNRSRRIILKNLPGYRNSEDMYEARENSPKLTFHLYESSGTLPEIYLPLLLTTTKGYETKSKSELMHSRSSIQYVHYRLESWQEMNQRYLESKYFGLQLIKYFNHKPIFKTILKDNYSDIEKTNAIYSFIQQKMKWNGIHATYASKGLTKPYNKGKGNSCEINLLLIYLLRKANLDADPVLIRTRDLGRPETTYPVRNQFNHVIALVNINGTKYALDATGTKAFNDLPDKDINYAGWVVSKKDFGWVRFKKNGNKNGILAVNSTN